MCNPNIPGLSEPLATFHELLEGRNHVTLPFIHVWPPYPTLSWCSRHWANGAWDMETRRWSLSQIQRLC